MHLCAELTAATRMLEPFGEVCAIFLYFFFREHGCINRKPSLLFFFCLQIFKSSKVMLLNFYNEPVHEISNKVVCATSKSSDQPAHTRSLIRAFASRLSNL